MNELISTNITNDVLTQLTPIEIALGIDEQGRTTSRKLYEFLELDKSNYSRWSKRNIEENEFAEENMDYIRLVMDDERNPNPTTDYKLTASFAKKLAMGTHNERGEQAKNYFVRVEDKLKERAIAASNLSPQLQLLINMELEQKKLRQQLNEVNHHALQAQAQSAEAKQEIQSMRDVITLSPNSWRQDTTKLINAIAQQLGGFDHIRNVREESYKLLNERYGVDVKTRLTNKRRRMADEGVCKSKRDKLTVLDVIADDKKLIEGYIAIVKVMAIKYKAA